MISETCNYQTGDTWSWNPLGYYWTIPWYPPTYQKVYETCHGSAGKGWVYTEDGKPYRCPVCHGSGKYSDTDWVITWNGQ